MRIDISAGFLCAKQIYACSSDIHSQTRCTPAYQKYTRKLNIHTPGPAADVPAAVAEFLLDHPIALPFPFFSPAATPPRHGPEALFRYRALCGASALAPKVKQIERQSRQL